MPLYNNLYCSRIRQEVSRSVKKCQDLSRSAMYVPECMYQDVCTVAVRSLALTSVILWA